jgi:TPR repeat protein
MVDKRTVAVVGMLCSIWSLGCARGVQAPASPTPEAMPELTEAVITASIASAAKAYESTCAKTVLDARTIGLYTKACAAGDGEGCRRVSTAHMCGPDRDKSGAAAIALAERACALGDDKGCRMFVAGLIEGRDVTRDTGRALRVLDASCTRGSADSCGSIGGMLMLNGNIDRGMPYLVKACESDADACANIAIVEARGLGGRAKNPERAFSFAKRACEAKSMFGCQTLGFLFGSGIGTKQDWSKAHALFAIACDGGNAQGCLNLAKCQVDGLGTREDTTAGMASLTKACDLGDGTACRVLADVTAQPSTQTGASPVLF